MCIEKINIENCDINLCNITRYTKEELNNLFKNINIEDILKQGEITFNKLKSNTVNFFDNNDEIDLDRITLYITKVKNKIDTYIISEDEAIDGNYFVNEDEYKKIKDLEVEQKDLDPEIQNLMNKNFWGLFEDSQKKENIIEDEILSAGICDTCSVPKMIRDGNGIDEPFHEILYCKKINREIVPELPDDRMIECEFYVKNEDKSKNNT